MISKHVGRRPRTAGALGTTELAAGHLETAMQLLLPGGLAYGRAQHPIFELNDEKRFLYAGLRRTATTR